MQKDAEQSPHSDAIKPDMDRIVQAMTGRAQNSATLRPVGGYTLPQLEVAARVISLLRQILFPGYVGRLDITPDDLSAHIQTLTSECFELLADQVARSFRHNCRETHEACDQCRNQGKREAALFITKLPDIRDRLEEDVQASFDGDPAARSHDEIIFSYPGFFAITVHRIAHELHLQGIPMLPRLMSELAHSTTGIDIHPGARIGRFFFIDHGTGVVIGETALIGDHVKMYQGATLGALSFPRDACGALLRGAKRHPTLEDHVTIYAGATVLGGDTVIGQRSVIGGNVWLTHSIPPGTKVIVDTPNLKFRDSNVTVEQEYVPDFQI